MKLLNKGNKQYSKESLVNRTKEIETEEKTNEEMDSKNESESLDNPNENQEERTTSITQEESKNQVNFEHTRIEESKNQLNFEHTRTNEYKQNVCDIQQGNGVVISSDTKKEMTSENASSSLGTNKAFSGLIINGKVNSYNSQVQDDRPHYFGIRSYLHNFYDPPDKEIMNSGEYSQDEFLTEPTKENHKGCLVQTVLWIGINLTLVGTVALIVGHFVPDHATIVGYQDNLQILDRSAVTFNRYLELCRIIGFIFICIGSMVILIMIFISKKCIKKEPTYYYVLGATVMPEMFIGNPLVGPQRQPNGSILTVKNIVNNVK